MAQGGGEGSRPEGTQDPCYCSLASDNQLSFDGNNLNGESKQLKLTFPAQPCSYEEFGS